MFDYQIGDVLPLSLEKPELTEDSVKEQIAEVNDYTKVTAQEQDYRLTVQIVAYNEAEGLLQCLDALQAQTDPDFCIQLVDNGLDSTTRDALRSYPLLHIVLKKNEGCSQGRNIGAALCTTPLINFLDADGIVAPDYITTCKRLMADPTITAIRGLVWSTEESVFTPAHYDLGDNKVATSISCEGNSVWRTKDFCKAGGFEACLAGGEGPVLCYRMHALFDYPLDSFVYFPELRLQHPFFKSDAHLQSKLDKYTFTRDAVLRRYPLITDMEKFYAAAQGKTESPNTPELDELRAEKKKNFISLNKSHHIARGKERLNTYSPQKMQEHYDFCVVIPCYNLGASIWDTVDSLMSQTLDSLQVLVIDDCSDDPQTIATLQELEKYFPVLRLPENSGVSAARNLGIEHARSNYILCLDADDAIEPSYLEKAFNIFEVQSSTGIVSTWMKYHGLHDSKWCPKDKISIEEALVKSPVPTASCFRKSAWQQVGGYDVTMRGYEDWNFWITLMNAGWQVRVIGEYLFNYTVRPKSKVKTSNVNMEELLARIISNHRELYKEHMEYVLLARHREIVKLRSEVVQFRIQEKQRKDASNEE